MDLEGSTVAGVRISDSAVHGKGVFAERVFSEGEPILPIDDSRVVDGDAPLDAAAGELAHHCDYLAHGLVVLLRPPERYINHCCDPNTFTRTIGGVRWVVARRDIERGEELTCDYCINSSGDTLWDCSCASPCCRRRIHSDFFHLPLELQLDYLPLLDEWFRREHAAAVQGLELARR